MFLSTKSLREQGQFSYHRVAFSAGLGRESSHLVVSQQLPPPTLGEAVRRWCPFQTGAQKSLGTLSGGTWRKLGPGAGMPRVHERVHSAEHILTNPSWALKSV